MTTLEEIARELDAQVSNCAVARRVGCSPERVRRVRAVVGLPAYRRGHRPAFETLEEAYTARVLAVEDGHVEWTGPVSEYGTPLVRLGTQTTTAYRVAFRAHHGRDAEGRTVPVCGYPHCVAGGHLEDRVMRERRESRGLITDPPAGATWHRDVDLVAVDRAVRGDSPRPELTEREQRYAVVVMTRAGYSGEAIAGRLGILERTVVRWRAHAGLSEPGPGIGQ
ncbi:helix-turn-helix domain-containing protein [Streptomyces sp. DH12]|uniref:helix-turn-helix transcriptional regulator n=1 Tax=Streptomyces sp. DH12 TaxID=2857010 RepID=UPI001E57EA90|nr:helix-turn-helix domain-containing protein [Streptomyces sp. DH12]